MSEPDTKLKIIRAAKKLFAQNGFDGTSTRDIVSVAGANISLISYYFGSKENLFCALFEGFPAPAYDRMPENCDQLLEELDGIIARIVMLRFDEPDLVTILQQELYRQSARSEKLVELLAPTWNRIRALIELGKAQGLFRVEHVDTALSFVMAVASFPRQHSLYRDYLREKESSQDVARETLKFILRGLGCAKQEQGGELK
ncbi:MAG: TetR family transcriptional regulator [Mobilitalea sp.]